MNDQFRIEAGRLHGYVMGQPRKLTALGSPTSLLEHILVAQVAQDFVSHIGEQPRLLQEGREGLNHSFNMTRLVVYTADRKFPNSRYLGILTTILISLQNLC